VPLSFARKARKPPESTSAPDTEGLASVGERRTESTGTPLFLRQPFPGSGTGESATSVAYTDDRGTYVSPAADASPDRALIQAHESVHRAQFALGGGSVASAGEDVLEGEAQAGAHEIMAGGAFTPRNAAGAGMRLHFGPTSPLSGTIGTFGEQEMQSLQTLRPGPADVNSKITAEGSEDLKTRIANYHYEFETSAKGQRGSITTRTLLDIHYDPNDPHGWITPSTELGTILPPEYWKFYPITISYQRTIAYSDEYGRTLDVDVYGQARLDYAQWEAVLRGHPDLSQLTLADIAQIKADSAFMNANITGDGDLTYIVEHDYPSMPSDVKNEMLRGAPKISYGASVNASGSGSSLYDTANMIAQGMMSPDSTFATQLSMAPGLFVHLQLNAGVQYDTIRIYLESRDALAIPRLQREIEDRLAHPGGAAQGGPAMGGGGGDGVLGDVLNWLADLWDSLPAGLRGTLKAIGKAAAVVVGVVVLAIVIVALAPVELSVAAVALGIGAVLLGAGFLYSIYQRSIESFETGKGNPLTVFLVSLADTVGISGIYEGITNESILSGRSLNLTEEEQYEHGVGGALQLLLLALGLRSRRAGPGPVIDEPVVGLEPARRSAVEPPPGAARGSAPADEPFFTQEEIDTMLDDPSSPAVKGRARPRIEDRRVPGEPPRRLDLQDLPRRAGETARQALLRVKRIIGQRLDRYQAIRDAWNRAARQVLDERGALRQDNYLDHYDAVRRQFWRNVRDDAAARQIFDDAGFEFPGDRTTAPMLRGTSPDIPAEGTRLSLDHILEKAQGNNWQKALDADNLEMTFQDPNSMREIVQMRHPDLRPPPPTPPAPPVTD